MDGRMTVCNMSIEAGARAGLIAPTRRPSATCRGGPTPRRGRRGRRRSSTGGRCRPIPAPCSTAR
jgi:homoaconitase/3-isopropylmalate dehydratase large subunit